MPYFLLGGLNSVRFCECHLGEAAEFVVCALDLLGGGCVAELVNAGARVWCVRWACAGARGVHAPARDVRAACVRVRAANDTEWKGRCEADLMNIPRGTRRARCAGMAEGLGASIESLVGRSPMRELLLRCCKVS